MIAVFLYAPAMPRVILNDLLPRTRGQRNPSAAKIQRAGFQIEIKENKTPGDEHYLDPPGAELLAWSKN